MKLVMLPVSFLFGALAGGLGGRYWRARRDKSAVAVRGQKIKLVLAPLRIDREYVLASLAPKR